MKGPGLIMLILLVLGSVTGTALAGDIEKGKALFNDTTLGTNGKSCDTCHPDGRKINGNKKSFTILGEKQGSIEDAVNFCIKMALSGKPLGKDSEEMENLVSYLRSLEGRKKRKSPAPAY